MESSPVAALIDLGSNSVRLMVVRINPNGSHTVLTRYKQMVRLGEDAFLKGRLAEQAMRRTIDALHGIAGICRGYDAGEVVAYTTAAVRDAQNGGEFLERAATESGIRFAVISGLEEARLIHLGVSAGLRFAENRTALFVDIGGGSTELIVGRGADFLHLDSLKLGAVRVANAFLRALGNAPVPPGLYDAIRSHVRSGSLRSVQKLRGMALEMMVGSSGTIENLAEIASKDGGGDGLSLTLKSLAETAKKLCALTLEERKKVPGIQPQRADIIVAGAAVLQALMEDLGMEELQVSRLGLLEGMLRDYLLRGRRACADEPGSFREQSVLQLARSCGFNEVHSRWTARLALELFDGARALKLHTRGREERELLYYAGLLHDVGLFLSFSDHHSHSRYIIKNAGLLGFNREEIDVMANAAYFHRKWSPGKNKTDPLYNALEPKNRETADVLGLFLRMGENLDRSQQQTVASASLRRGRKGGRIELRLALSGPSPAELYSVERTKPVFRKILGREFDVTVSG